MVEPADPDRYQTPARRVGRRNVRAPGRDVLSCRRPGRADSRRDRSWHFRDRSGGRICHELEAPGDVAPRWGIAGLRRICTTADTAEATMRLMQTDVAWHHAQTLAAGAGGGVNGVCRPAPQHDAGERI